MLGPPQSMDLGHRLGACLNMVFLHHALLPVPGLGVTPLYLDRLFLSRCFDLRPFLIQSGTGPSLGLVGCDQRHNQVQVLCFSQVGLEWLRAAVEGSFPLVRYVEQSSGLCQ